MKGNGFEIWLKIAYFLHPFPLLEVYYPPFLEKESSNFFAQSLNLLFQYICIYMWLEIRLLRTFMGEYFAEIYPSNDSVRFHVSKYSLASTIL